MKTIIIHHLQEMWNDGLERYGTSFEIELEKVLEHLNEVDYDKVIVTNFEAGFDLEDSQYPLKAFNPVIYDYCYGWEREQVEDYGYIENKDYCEGGMHSEVVLIDGWMHDLQGEIFICGAFDGECIEDLEIALEGANKPFNRLNHLIT